jgi:hypothetical protein
MVISEIPDLTQIFEAALGAFEILDAPDLANDLLDPSFVFFVHRS